MTRPHLNAEGWKAVRVAVVAARSIFLSLSLARFSPGRSIPRCTWLQASRCTLLQRPSRTRNGDLHCKALPAERILLPMAPLRGQGLVRKGQRVRRVRWPSINSPASRIGHLLSTCAVCMHLLAVETQPSSSSSSSSSPRQPSRASFQSPLYFPLHLRPDDRRLHPGRKSWPSAPVLGDSHRLLSISFRFLYA